MKPDLLMFGAAAMVRRRLREPATLVSPATPDRAADSGPA